MPNARRQRRADPVEHADRGAAARIARVRRCSRERPSTCGVRSPITSMSGGPVFMSAAVTYVPCSESTSAAYARSRSRRSGRSPLRHGRDGEHRLAAAVREVRPPPACTSSPATGAARRRARPRAWRRPSSACRPSRDRGRVEWTPINIQEPVGCVEPDDHLVAVPAAQQLVEHGAQSRRDDHDGDLRVAEVPGSSHLQDTRAESVQDTACRVTLEGHRDRSWSADPRRSVWIGPPIRHTTKGLWRRRSRRAAGELLDSAQGSDVPTREGEVSHAPQACRRCERRRSRYRHRWDRGRGWVVNPGEQDRQGLHQFQPCAVTDQWWQVCRPGRTR